MITGIIDADVHNSWQSPDDLAPFVEGKWAELLGSTGGHLDIPFGANSGISAASSADAALTARQLAESVFDQNVERAVLTFDARARAIAMLPNPYLAATLVRAANDWLAHDWLGRDPRFLGSILIANQLPDQAAEEIRRCAGDPQFVQVLLCDNGLGKPFGHPAYDPIFAAAVEAELPLCIAASGFGGSAPSPIGGGYPSTLVEFETLIAQSTMTHLVSLITQGVFDRYPSLKVVLTGVGQAWLAPLLWRFDTNYKGTRREIPWTKSLPSEYVLNHVRVTTAPLDMPPRPELLIRAIDAVGGSSLLLFASNQPSWDGLHWSAVADRLPTEWAAPVFRDNAMRCFGIGTPSAASIGGGPE